MTQRARFIDHDLIDCFEEGLCDDDGEPVDAEVSAAVFDGKKLLFGSDKPVPGKNRSAVFSIDYDDSGLRRDSIYYYTNPKIKESVKYEDFALTPDWRYVIASTGFDRVGEGDSAELHEYNTMLIWPLDNPDAAQVVAPQSQEGVTSSVRLRDGISQALGGAPYFKVEGLATLPADKDHAEERLLLGIREVGQDHENFDYAAKVIAAPYRIEGGQLELTDKLRLVYDFDVKSHQAVTETVGLSSVEYDAFAQRVFLTTSFETDTEMGGYLWVMSLEDFEANRAPTLVMDEQGASLRFEDKPEGVAVLSKDRLFLIYDNDRARGGRAEETTSTTRKPHQAPYSVLELL